MKIASTFILGVLLSTALSWSMPLVPRELAPLSASQDSEACANRVLTTSDAGGSWSQHEYDDQGAVTKIITYTSGGTQPATH